MRQTPVTQGVSPQADQLNILFICSSLGEYESIEPIISAIKTVSNIHLSFFSESGYRMLKKETHVWSTLSYTPLDRRVQVQKYLDEINPDRIVIAHNFMWPQLLQAIIDRGIKMYLIEHSIDTSKRIKIMWASLWKDAYQHASLITSSDQETVDYFANQKGLTHIMRTESLRYLSTLNYHESNWTNELIEQFCARRPTLILGSVHLEDIRVFAAIYEELVSSYQLLIVPHHIDDETIHSLKSHFKEGMTYSHLTELSDDPILIIDQIGMLKYLYRYATVAYIGGGFGRGIHSAQEAVPYGIPILFGPKYQKFAYAKQLIKDGRAQKIRNSDELLTELNALKSSDKSSYTSPIDRVKLEQDVAYIAHAIIN